MPRILNTITKITHFVSHFCVENRKNVAPSAQKYRENFRFRKLEP